MGSVISYDIECPECKQEKGTSDYYYKTQEEYFHCENCKLSYSYQLKRDDDGNLITRDGTKNHDYENLIMIEMITKYKEITSDTNAKNQNSTSTRAPG